MQGGKLGSYYNNLSRDCDLRQYSYRGDVETCSKFRYILKVEPMGFANRLDVGGERENDVESRMMPWVWSGQLEGWSCQFTRIGKPVG